MKIVVVCRRQVREGANDEKKGGKERGGST